MDIFKDGVNLTEFKVKSWFEVADKKGFEKINLSNSTYLQKFNELTKPFIYRGVDTGLIEYENGLYRVSLNEGDDMLFFLGEMKGK